MLGRIRSGTLLAVAGTSCALGALAVGSAAGASNVVTAPRTTNHLTFRGTVNLAAIAARSAPATSSSKARPASPLRPKSRPPAAAVRGANPTPASTPLRTPAGPPLGFSGLGTTDSAAVNGFDVEPPDQGLCATAGTVMEAVNLAVGVYTENGITLLHPVSLNSFFGLAPAVSIGRTTTFGPFLSDPRCYYDAQTQRWYITVLEIDINPTTGAFGYRSSELIAVSQTSDPTGNYGLFSIDSTNDGSDGTPSQPNCPCFGDQPRIGADANGFYISTDSYPIHGLFNSNGGMIYAMSKQGLADAAAGTVPPPPVVSIDIGAVIIGGYPANAVQPAETPQGGKYASDREYFLSTPDFNGFATMGGAGASSVVLWSLAGTSTLSSSPSGVSLSEVIVPSEAFTPPVNANQKPGPHPLGESFGEPIPPITVNDDRMQQVEYLNGVVYSSLNTGVGSAASARSGVAWFAVKTNGTNGTVTNQGYLATGNGASLMYPAIGLGTSGKGAMAFSISGPSIYPSAAYIPFNQIGPTGGAINVVGAGVLPEDGFTCYAEEGFGPSCRWGDYSAASSDGKGHIVMGAEMIANQARDPLANWNTYLSTVTP
jgi:hypothetical protein